MTSSEITDFASKVIALKEQIKADQDKMISLAEKIKSDRTRLRLMQLSLESMVAEKISHDNTTMLQQIAKEAVLNRTKMQLNQLYLRVSLM